MHVKLNGVKLCHIV